MTNIVQAHKSALACLALNPSGTLMATASDKGTVIRVFGVPNGDKIAQFRRGTYPARIYSIAFNAVSSLLGVTSDSDTVHIFKLATSSGGVKAGEGARAALGRSMSDLADDDTGSNSSGRPGGFEAFIDSKRTQSMTGTLRKKSLSLGRGLAGSVGTFLPSGLTSMWEPQRDYAFLKLPTPGVKSIIAMSSTTPQVYVVSSEGILYIYHIDFEAGGECVLSKSHNLMDGLDDVADASSAM